MQIAFAREPKEFEAKTALSFSFETPKQSHDHFHHDCFHPLAWQGLVVPDVGVTLCAGKQALTTFWKCETGTTFTESM